MSASPRRRRRPPALAPAVAGSDAGAGFLNHRAGVKAALVAVARELADAGGGALHGGEGAAHEVARAADRSLGLGGRRRSRSRRRSCRRIGSGGTARRGGSRGRFRGGGSGLRWRTGAAAFFRGLRLRGRSVVADGEGFLALADQLGVDAVRRNFEIVDQCVELTQRLGFLGRRQHWGGGRRLRFVRRLRRAGRLTSAASAEHERGEQHSQRGSPKDKGHGSKTSLAGC